MSIQSFFEQYQMGILKYLGILCFILGFFVCIARYSIRRRKTAMLQIEFGTAVMLLSDMFAYSFRLDTSTVGFWGIRIANFLLFITTYLIIYGFNNYIVSLVMGRDKLRKIPFRLILGFVLPGIGSGMVIASQFFHFLYDIDETNMYHRGEFAWIGFALPAVILFIQLTVVLQYFKLFKGSVFISLVLFIGIPAYASWLQLQTTGISAANISVGLAAVCLYAFSLAEQNYSMHNAYITDMPTGLPNTHGYLIEIDKKLANRTIKDYCSIYFDINRMGLINRKYGNDSGDAAIKAYAKYIDAKLEKGEVLGRLGGNFFIALIRKENKVKFLEMLREVPISVKVDKKYVLMKLSATAGGFEPSNNHVTPEQMIGYPAQALNLAKNVYKKPYVFMTSDLLNQVERDRQVEAQIPVALEEKEFVPFYQPKVDSVTGEVCGAEALVRWIHDGVTVPPIQFIPVMERNDNICALDFYMLDYVCKDIKHWLEVGFTPPTISVNFSRRNLGNPKFVQDVYRTIMKNEVPLNFIQIEVTETIDEYPMSLLKEVVLDLQELGISVAIDDFGVGSSSINLLKEVSFDVLKIDKSFIDCDTEKDVRLLGYIIEIAKSMGAEIVAEGVEREEQLEQLASMGCKTIQGYYYSKPIPKYEFESYVHDRKRRAEQ